MTKKVIVFLAEGFEEIEAVIPVDYLRRADVNVTTCAIGENLTVKGAHGISINADTTLGMLEKRGRDKAEAWDAAVVPGGMPGASNLAACRDLRSLLVKMAASGKLVCAICASPVVVFAPIGLLSSKKFTCYPGMENKAKNGTWTADKTVVDGNIITSQGPGTAGEFAIAIIRELLGENEAKKIADSVVAG